MGKQASFLDFKKTGTRPNPVHLPNLWSKVWEWPEMLKDLDLGHSPWMGLVDQNLYCFAFQVLYSAWACQCGCAPFRLDYDELCLLGPVENGVSVLLKLPPRLEQYLIALRRESKRVSAERCSNGVSS